MCVLRMFIVISILFSPQTVVVSSPNDLLLGFESCTGLTATAPQLGYSFEGNVYASKITDSRTGTFQRRSKSAPHEHKDLCS